MTATVTAPALYSNEAKFQKFDADNPWVFTELEKMTAQWLTYGHKRASIAMFWEVLRWTNGTAVKTDEVFKLSNNHKPWYVRKLIAKHPEWQDVFSLREMWVA